MEFIVEHYEIIVTAITSLASVGVAITSLVKALKSETRTKKVVAGLETQVAITREGIVEAFKKAVVTKDVKVSINKQVEKVLTERLDKFEAVIENRDEARTRLVYWALKILANTAAVNKLSPEQLTELDELLLRISKEDQIVDTSE